MVEKWFADFKRGRTNTDDAERSTHPNSLVVPENIKIVHKMVLADSILKLREIAETLNISEGSLHSVKKVPGINHSKSPLKEIVKNLSDAKLAPLSSILTSSSSAICNLVCSQCSML